jgi:glycosyltransferase involved in cell wall biosynthesis
MSRPASGGRDGRRQVDALALVPAFNEADRVGATVRALRGLDGVAEVLVVSDGSSDGTAAAAIEAGAHCLDLPANIGKGGALNAGLAALTGRVAEAVTPEPVALLLVDADLGSSAGELRGLLEPVLADKADLAIADLPPQPGAKGFGVAIGMARWGLRRIGGRTLAEPLCGQRAVRWSALSSLVPFATGFGVEVAMTLDAWAAGLRVVEVPLELRHRPTGRDLRGIVHRARQAGSIARELARHRVWRPAPAGRDGTLPAPLEPPSREGQGA